jgi:hypothetical protein
MSAARAAPLRHQTGEGARSPVGKREGAASARRPNVRYCEMRRISEASFEKHGRRSLMVAA